MAFWSRNICLEIDYFRGLEARFKGSKHKAIFPDVPPLETSVARANKLAEAIDKEFPEGAIHIIAHSMGGLRQPHPDRT